MNKVIFSLIVFFLSVAAANAQQGINWMSWDEAMSKTEKRKILVDVYTEWCGWCKKMDKSTFANPTIVEYINKNYYAVKFDAEYKREITHNDKVYKFVRGGKNGYHELAAEMLQGRLSFPTLVFLDENHAVLQPIPGFMDSGTLNQIMRFFGEDHFKDTPWPKYTRMYEFNDFPVDGMKNNVTPAKMAPSNGVPARVAPKAIKGNGRFQ